MIDPFVLFALGNAVALLGSLPMMYRVYKNREKLAAYDLVGSSLTLSAMIFFLLGFISARNTVNIILSSFPFLFWLLVVGLKLKAKYIASIRPIEFTRLGYDEYGNKTC